MTTPAPGSTPAPAEAPRPTLSSLEVGQVVLTEQVPVSRASLVKYAGASGDFNHIHWNERFAKEVGLPNVIAHGMLTMGSVAGRITDWTGDPGSVVDLRTRFTAPVVVPDSESGAPDQPTAFLDLMATVQKIDAEAGTATLAVEVTVDGEKVLGRTQAVVRLGA
ncbi:MaoC/PaaZ C-terminal domain-containing protein [Brevibacterium samyangense]|uniref:MaoC family dehydratase n=1 Tax=Brevibacterium samyangense TaxID=366888 RepID=A0ABN2TI34_9MICO